MHNKCDRCPLIFCDFVSRDCLLSAKEIAVKRPELISERFRREAAKAKQLAQALINAKANAPVFKAKRVDQQARAALKYKKYDARYKNSRRYWRNSEAGI